MSTDLDLLSDLVPPIILVGDGQVELFSDSRSVEVGIEAVDAELYRAYDSQGRVLRLHGEYREGRILGPIGWVENGPVSLECVSNEPARAEELRAALLDWWLRTRGSPEAVHWSLDQMVSAVATRDGVKQF